MKMELFFFIIFFRFSLNFLHFSKRIIFLMFILDGSLSLNLRFACFEHNREYLRFWLCSTSFKHASEPGIGFTNVLIAPFLGWFRSKRTCFASLLGLFASRGTCFPPFLGLYASKKSYIAPCLSLYASRGSFLCPISGFVCLQKELFCPVSGVVSLSRK